MKTRGNYKPQIFYQQGLAKLVLLYLLIVPYYSLLTAQEVTLKGNEKNNFVRVIEEFNNSIYYITATDDDESYLTKTNLSGSEIWKCPLSSEFMANDLTILNNRIFVVGRSAYAFNFSNNSVITSIDDLGSSYSKVSSKEFNISGRDNFTRVIKHHSLPDHLLVQSFSQGDDVNLITFDTDLNMVSGSVYDSGDDQFWGGLKDDQLGITLTGNLGGFNSGCMVNFNNDLDVKSAYKYNNIGYINDHIDKSDNSRIITGNTSDNKGFIAEVDSSGNQIWAKIIDQTSLLNKVNFLGTSTTQNGTQDRYIINGRAADNTFFILKIAVNNNNQGQQSLYDSDQMDFRKKSLKSNNAFDLSILWAKQMVIEGTKSEGNIYTWHNNLIYAIDQFSNLPNGFGGVDYSLSVTDDNFNSCISIPLNYTVSDLIITPQAFTVTKSAYSIPNAITQSFLPEVEFSLENICVPATCLIDTLSINTGYNSITDDTYDIMTQDGFWILEDACQDNGPVNLGSPAWNIEKHPAWSAPGYKSTYISAFSNPGSNLANINTGDPYKFRRCFCSAYANTEIEFDINVHVDNQMKFFLYDPANGTQTLLGEVTNGSSTSNFKGQPEHLNITPITLGPSGQYCIEAELRNDHTDTPMGLNIEGWISGDGITTDACCNQTSYITGYKYRDQDCDGVVGFGDPIVADWVIELLDAEGTVISKDTTDSNGYYVFEVTEGEYTLNEIEQEEWEYSTPENGQFDIFYINANEVVQKDFGNIYVGPLETTPLESSCYEVESNISFEWIGKSCDCQMTLYYRDCNDASQFIPISDVENTGSYTYNIPEYLIGDIEFMLEDCEGNQVPFVGCITISEFDLKIAAVQTDCGEYEFSYTVTELSPSDIASVAWNFGVLGSSTIANPTYTFEESGDYQIKLQIITNDGCILRQSMTLNALFGSLDENCNFCPPNVLSEIEQGDLYIYDECFGMIIKSPNGSCFRIKVSDEGLLYAQAIDCPDTTVSP